MSLAILLTSQVIIRPNLLIKAGRLLGKNSRLLMESSLIEGSRSFNGSYVLWWECWSTMCVSHSEIALRLDVRVIPGAKLQMVHSG